MYFVSRKLIQRSFSHARGFIKKSAEKYRENNYPGNCSSSNEKLKACTRARARFLLFFFLSLSLALPYPLGKKSSSPLLTFFRGDEQNYISFALIKNRANFHAREERTTGRGERNVYVGRVSFSLSPQPDLSLFSSACFLLR